MVGGQLRVNDSSDALVNCSLSLTITITGMSCREISAANMNLYVTYMTVLNDII